jgi:hypothetical protein
MQRILLLFFVAVLSIQSAAADYPHEFLVTVRAQSQLSPPRLQFTWEEFGASVNIYRIDPEQSTDLGPNVWGAPLAALPAGASSWTDTTPVVGKRYEYRFELVGGPNTLHPSVRNSVVLAGVDMAPQHQRGRLLLIVDDSLSSPLQAELLQLQADLVGDGWRVTRQDLPSSISARELKSAISTLYQESPSDTKALYLLGALPIVKSGCIGPDGHDPRPQATDSFYADLDGVWTDSAQLNCPLGNRPGDGRYDQFTVPSALEMGVGRVDFSNLPDYSETPTELTRRYLEKAHRFRQHEFTPSQRSIIFNQGVSLTAAVNVIPVTGVWDILDMNLNTTPRPDLWQEMQSKSFLWLFKGGGGGMGDGMAQIGTTASFAASPGVLVPFWGVLGSGNGYWEIGNAFGRGIIASRGATLAFAWADRPVWRLHTLSGGQTWGDAMALTVNHTGKYWESLYLRPLQVNLMGDPALRISSVAPVASLRAAVAAQTVTLSWSAPAPDILGYYLYRAPTKDGPFVLLNQQALTSTSYTDSAVSNGTHHYMLRAAKRELNGGGSYINLSQGRLTSVTVSGATSPQPPERLRMR